MGGLGGHAGRAEREMGVAGAREVFWIFISRLIPITLQLRKVRRAEVSLLGVGWCILVGGAASAPARTERKLIVKITPIDDERVLHTTTFRSAPANICTSLFSHVQRTMPQAAASRARSWACFRGNTLAEYGSR